MRHKGPGEEKLKHIYLLDYEYFGLFSVQCFQSSVDAKGCQSPAVKIFSVFRDLTIQPCIGGGGGHQILETKLNSIFPIEN
jgi:hypothetical protein